MKKFFILIAAMVMAAVCETCSAGTDKTLVSWVTLSDKKIRAGSILTVQDGPVFDGIVFAELSGGKWMAGSDTYKRTKKEQADSPVEKADAKTLIQMAIVYKGDQVSIYRNGAPYASYKTTNVDLLSRKNNIVVFGLRHVGGGSGSIGGAIDDARIYSKALSAEEIKALEPNKASSIKPYAWWDFEGKKVVDRTGRYEHSKLGGGAKLADGKLVLGKGAVLVAGRTQTAANVSAGRRSSPPRFVGPYVPETPAWPKNPPDNWAIYHLAHPTFTQGSPFDPNPAFYYKGRYHLHYIYKPRAGFSFAHVSSTDMVHWKWHPTVLAPPVTGHGMFSGTGFFTKEGKPVMVYCGWGSNRNWILYGLDDDLNKWGNAHVMLPKDKDGKLLDKARYFDPDIWLDGDTYYGLNGHSSSTPPFIMHSKDLKNWTQTGPLLHPDFDEKKLGVRKGEDISCPNMFKLGKKWVLVCISHRLGCRYFIGEFKNGQYLPESHALMGGLSKRFFAPESLLTKDGRRVMWAWFFGGQTRGVQSLPRELELPEDGILRIKPLRELESLRYDEQSEENIAVKKDADLVLKKIKGDHLELKVVVKDTGEKNFGAAVLCDDRGKAGVRITVNRTKNMLEVGTEKAPFKLKKAQPLTLRIFVDGTIVEVFANDVQAVIADKKRAAGAKIDDRVVLFSTGGDLKIDKITAWKMKSSFNTAKP
ncbi:MAG: GH32 C-terminal domain-containing protein [Phycisphaerae bacterium]|nr:GH32 C-terminal domain-containing protein [Phycisphaerae bacterium]